MFKAALERAAVLMWIVPFPGVAATSRECAACHPAIYASFMRTPMAASSGRAGGGTREEFGNNRFIEGVTGFRYTVTRSNDGYAMEIDGGGLGAAVRRTLPYFAGSGAAARSYLLMDDGFLYEAPVAYYSAARRWDLPPGYAGSTYPNLTRPIQPGCLSCHASDLNPIAGTQNRYGSPPFGEGGVSCERCHGPGERHIAQAKAGRSAAASIVNPAKLDPERRDSVCAQCHLSGEVRVMRPGARWNSYQPGDRLSSTQTVFVRADASPGLTVTGHVEKLAQSACKQAAGDRMWCGSCHEPHPSRTSTFRAKCVSCHESTACTEKLTVRSARQDDCAACHMPKTPVTDARHVVYTDHSIPKLPRANTAVPRRRMDLVPFGGGPPSDRDLALAYAIIAARPNHSEYRPQALSLLEKVDSTSDSEALLYLAGIYRNSGQADRAVPLYERAMRLDPDQVTASVGLGAIRMERGQYAEAIRLWEDSLSKNGGLVLVRTNLAMAYWRRGDRSRAEAHLKKTIEMSPGFKTPVELLKQVQQAGSTSPPPRF